MKFKIRIEFKLADFWLGVFWDRKQWHSGSSLDVWICLIPMFPIHIQSSLSTISSLNFSAFEKLKFKSIVQKAVTQGPEHEKNITEMYQIIREAAKKEFYEDNAPTLDSFLEECFRDSIISK